MSNKKQPLSKFVTGNSVSVDILPVGRFVFLNQDRNFYVKLNSNGLSPSSNVTFGIQNQNLIKHGGKVPFSKAMFYGGVFTPYYNKASLVSSLAVLIIETSVGTARARAVGANVGVNALFYGGYSGATKYSKVTLLSPTATLVQTETNVGANNGGKMGANVGTNALFYGGYTTSMVNTATILSPTATLVQAETNIGRISTQGAGANVGVNALFNGGYDVNSNTVNITTVLTPTATLVQAESNIGTARNNHAGANIGINALFTDGITATILTPTATLFQAESSISGVYAKTVGANVGINVVLYGGAVGIGNVALISPTLTVVAVDTLPVTQRIEIGGASL